MGRMMVRVVMAEEMGSERWRAWKWTTLGGGRASLAGV